MTGGARGLGLCIAASLLEADAAVVYCLDVLPSPDADEWAKAEAIARAKGNGARIEYRRLDCTDEQAVTEVIGRIYRENDEAIKGRDGAGQGGEKAITISRFFGAAGVQQMLPAMDFPAKDFRRILEINTTGESLNLSISTSWRRRSGSQRYDTKVLEVTR